MLKRSDINMTEGPLLKNVILYTLPIIFTGILQLLFNAADLVVVGRFRGSVCVAAVGSTGALINLIINMFIGLSVGAGVTVAQAKGADDGEGMHRAVHTAILTALISGVILTAIGIPLAEEFLEMMDTPYEVLPLSAKYMRIYFAGIISSMVYNYGAAILRALGDTRGPLMFLTIAGIVNVGLNLMFVLLFGMDVDGVAWATVISQTIAASLVLISLSRRDDRARFRIKDLRIYKDSLLNIMKIGLPAGFQSVMFNISNVIIQSSVNSFDSVAVSSGNSSAANIEGFVYVSMNAFHQTALNFAGQNIGAGKNWRVRKILLCCLGCVTAFGLTLGVTGYLLGRPLLSIYIVDSEEAIKYGLTRLSFICLPYFLCGLMDVTTGALRGMGSSFVPMVITVLGVCVLRIVWIYTVFSISEFHTLEILYSSYIITWVVSFIAQMTAFNVVYKKIQKNAGKGDNIAHGTGAEVAT
ncbi:MAG: MATE family efflux transporter [Clostridia bacterium]|nr:MATE family efflux transporter [Clostridia bacterium]